MSTINNSGTQVAFVFGNFANVTFGADIEKGYQLIAKSDIGDTETISILPMGSDVNVTITGFMLKNNAIECRKVNSSGTSVLASDLILAR